jgi:hypothetical protein
MGYSPHDLPRLCRWHDRRLSATSSHFEYQRSRVRLRKRMGGDDVYHVSGLMVLGYAYLDLSCR